MGGGSNLDGDAHAEGAVLHQHDLAKRTLAQLLDGLEITR
jgi:hypothetical protein